MSAHWADDLDAIVGGDGRTVDGAQAPQLALARVVLADPHGDPGRGNGPARSGDGTPSERALAAVLAPPYRRRGREPAADRARRRPRRGDRTRHARRARGDQRHVRGPVALLAVETAFRDWAAYAGHTDCKGADRHHDQK